MAINGKKKGNKNEREVAQLFLQPWSGLEFKRVPQSGGLRGHVADYTVGDLVCVDRKMLNKVFPYSIECKSYKNIDFSKLLKIPSNKKGKEYQDSDIQEFWDQAVEDGKRGEKLPILIMRYNSLPKGFYFVALDRKLVTKKMLPKDRMVTKQWIITTSHALQAEIKWEVFFKESMKIWQGMYG